MHLISGILNPDQSDFPNSYVIEQNSPTSNWEKYGSSQQNRPGKRRELKLLEIIHHYYL